MLAKVLFYLLWSALLSISLCVIGVLISYFAQGNTAAEGLLKAWVIDFNGIIVGAAGWGLMFFVRNQGRVVLAQLRNIIQIPDTETPKLLRLHHRTTSWLWANLLSIPMTIIGAILLWNCGYPLAGFAKWYLAVSVSSIYYVASTILAFFIYSLALFNYIEEGSGNTFRPRLKRLSGLDIEGLDSFFVISATVGIIAIYLGFRGTLTASFTGGSEIFRNLLILPVLLYLPSTLCYSFYPRFVLRKVFERDIIGRIEELEKEMQKKKASSLKDDLELQMLLLELKAKLIAEHRSMPLLGFKDAPSLTISLLILVQLVLQKDQVVSEFIRGVLK